jgi:hypothetical protein
MTMGCAGKPLYFLCAVRPRSPATPQGRNAQDSETGYVNSKGYKEPRNANNAS